MPQLNAALLMLISQRYAEQRIMAALAQDGFDVTIAQGRVAAQMDPHGIRLTELAERAGITKQSAGFLVDQLQSAGYIERVPDPTDARARLVRFTRRAEAMKRRARREERAIEREWEQHLGPARMAAMREALESLREITDPYL